MRRKVKDDAAAVKHWETPEGGGMWAAGVGGSITGKGFNCFPSGTMVTTQVGEMDIATLYRLQDRPKVLSYNHLTGIYEWRKVTAAVKYQTEDALYEITTKQGRSVRATSDHRFFTAQDGYKQAQYLQAGNALVTATVAKQQGMPSLGTDSVSVVERLRGESIAVYDIEVEGNHNFFANEILVHNCGIIDDPIKNAEEAASEVIREKHKEWYRSTFETRREPDAAIIVIQTRWHEDDLTGWLLSQESGESPERWHVVCLPAIAEPVDRIPMSCTLEPDYRLEGEALCPERYNLDFLVKTKSKGSYVFDALYQQRPSSREGLFFHVSKLGFVDAASVGRAVRGWDKAATAGDGDYTAGVKMVKGHDGLFYIVGVKRGQWNTADRDKEIRLTAELDTRDTKHIGEQEPGSGGKESAENFVRLLAGFPVSTEKVSGSKELRADPFSSQVNAGNVRLLRGSWNQAYIEELRTFPNGKHDDQVDASSLAFNELNGSVAWKVSEFRF